MPSPGRPGRATFALKPVSFLSSRTRGRVCPSPFCAVLRQICLFQKKQNFQKNRFSIQKTPVLRDFPGASFPGYRTSKIKKEKPRPAFTYTENQNQKENPRPAFPDKERRHNGDGPHGVVLPIMPRSGMFLFCVTGLVQWRTWKSSDTRAT